MVRLITPVGMLIAVALLSIFAAYGFWTAYVDRSWMHAALGMIALVACCGTAMLRPWSRYLVYMLTAVFAVTWGHSVYAGASVGYYSIFVDSRLDAARSLAPGLALVGLSFVSSWFAYSHFRRAASGSMTSSGAVPPG